MSYVDAYYNKDKDIVNVVERRDGKRVYQDFPAWRTFYIRDDRGQHTSIHGEKVRQIKVKRFHNHSPFVKHTTFDHQLEL